MLSLLSRFYSDRRFAAAYYFLAVDYILSYDSIPAFVVRFVTVQLKAELLQSFYSSSINPPPMSAVR